jgi:hypothetical protein
LSVTIVPAEGPLLVATHEADAGKAYIAEGGTVTETLVRVDTKRAVMVCCAAVAVTVAARTPSEANVAAATTVAVLVSAKREGPAESPAAKFPRLAATAGSEWPNVRRVGVGRDATSEYASPPPITSMLTVLGTAYEV